MNPLTRLRHALAHVANRPRWLVAAVAGNFAACTAAYALIEHKGPIESAWWAVVTASTVGYGDQYPATTAGRGVGAWLIVSMVLLVNLATAQAAAHLVADPDCFTDQEQRHIVAALDDIRAAVARLEAAAAPAPQRQVRPSARLTRQGCLCDPWLEAWPNHPDCTMHPDRRNP